MHLENIDIICRYDRLKSFFDIKLDQYKNKKDITRKEIWNCVDIFDIWLIDYL